MADPSEYCSEADVYSIGLLRGSVSNRGQLADRADTATGYIFKGVHGLASGDEIQFRAEGGGSLPSPLAAGVTYYVRDVLEDSFRVASTSGGAAITLTTAGARFVFWSGVPWRAYIRWASALIEDSLPAHLVPVPEPVPEIIKSTAAELVAWKVQSLRGATTETLAAMIELVQKRMARWARGVPLRGPNVPEGKRANLAASASATLPDSRGWRRFGGL